MLFANETLEEAKANRPLTWNTTWTLEEVQASLEETLKLQEDFLAGLIPPRRIVGTGYKNARKVATEYLAGVVAEKRAMLAELATVA
jgi:hypothetical protein